MSPLSTITDDLVADLDGLQFDLPTTHVYNPFVYARKPWDLYCDRYGSKKREILLLGMNPGPWGMAQTGVPFGEVALARDWLELEAPVDKPAVEHPKRPIEGFACARSEVSGARLWGWAKDTFGTPAKFFRRFFVYNYCPLVFMEESGKNRTPDKLPVAERAPMEAACDRALRRVVEALDVKLAIGVGAFAEKRLKLVLEGTDVKVGRILHPSPASPIANRGWAPQATKDFEKLGVTLP